ncbi:MAG: flippase-like domain-containing protein [Chloroflexota bacterium]|nr:flippase-like domain-containing protein [Chloroflexota bacterium]
MSTLRSSIAPRAWTIARWAAAFGVVALLVVGLDGGEILERIRSANGLVVVPAVLGLVAVHALGALAWRTLCRQLRGLRLTWATCLRVYYAAQALGGVTPANLGGDAYRVLSLRNAGVDWSDAAAPVLVQRATSYLGLAILALPALGWLAISGRVPVAILAVGLVLCALAAGIALLLMMAPARLAGVLARLSWNPAMPRGEMQPEAVSPMHAPVRSLAIATGFALAFHAGSVLLTGLLVMAVDPSATGISVLAAIMVARLSLALPILPSGLGANEAILALLFGGLGLAPQAALAALLLTRVALVLTTLLGAGLLLFGRHEITRAETSTLDQPLAAHR